MKKIVLSLALVGSCALMTSNVQAQAISSGAASVATNQAGDIKIPDPPHFQSEDANKGVKEIVDLIKQYAPDIVNKDTAKIEEFQTKMVALQQSAGSWVGQLTPDEQQAFMKYFQDLQKVLDPEGSAGDDNSEEGN